MEIQEEIVEFLFAGKVATICYVKNGLPHCFNCMYAVMPGTEGIVFKSSGSSLHSQEMQNVIPVAGTVYYAAKSSFDNAGIQFSGKVTTDHNTCKIGERAYYKRFPMALVIPGRLITITFDTIKFSQTTNVVRRKMNWQRVSH